MSDHDARRRAVKAAEILLDADVLPDDAEDLVQSDEPFKSLAIARFEVTAIERQHETAYPSSEQLQRTEYDLDEMLRERLGYLLRSNQIEIPNGEDRRSVVEEAEL